MNTVANSADRSTHDLSRRRGVVGAMLAAVPIAALLSQAAIAEPAKAGATASDRARAPKQVAAAATGSRTVGVAAVAQPARPSKYDAAAAPGPRTVTEQNVAEGICNHAGELPGCIYDLLVFTRG